MWWVLQTLFAAILKASAHGGTKKNKCVQTGPECTGEPMRKRLNNEWPSLTAPPHSQGHFSCEYKEKEEKGERKKERKTMPERKAVCHIQA